MSETELYYTTALGEHFQAWPSDAEEVGLGDLHKGDFSRIEEFVSGPEGVLVMGGISGVGKTHVLSSLMRGGGFDYVDLHSTKPFQNGLDAFVDVDDHTTKKDGSRVLLVDESLARIQGTDKGLVDNVVKRLLNFYSHVVLAGGGHDYTSEAQTNLLLDSMPADLHTEGYCVPLKHLNRLQRSQLVERAPMGLLGQVNESDPDRQIDPEIARVVAEIMVRYFSLMREVIRFGLNVNLNGFSDLYDLRSHLYMGVRYGILSKECFEEAWREQEKAISENMGRLREVMEKVGK